LPIYFTPTVEAGTQVTSGDIVGTVQEGPVIEHRIMVPVGVSGTVKSIQEGDYTLEDNVYVLDTEQGEKSFTMMQTWPVRQGRPFAEKYSPNKIMTTGQRVIRSEEHTSELQSRFDLVCRLLLEKKKK